MMPFAHIESDEQTTEDNNKMLAGSSSVVDLNLSLHSRENFVLQRIGS